jgi:hypothetical protein
MEGFSMRFLNNRKLFILFTFFLVTLFSTMTCKPSASASEQAGIAAATPKGQTLYTQFSFFYEKNVYLTTNYRKGILVPVNTAVKFVKANNTNIVVTLPDGRDLTIQNIERYSGEKIDGIFKRTFAANPVDLSRFTENERKAIMAGEVKKGMKKSAVIIALGYPPKHKTPDLQMNQWTYWQNRFNTFVVYFQNEEVTGILD